MERVISASFIWDERDFVAACRATRMVGFPEYDSPVMRVGFLLLTHIFLLTGFLVVGLAVSGAKGNNGPIPISAVAMSMAFSLAAAYALFTRWYGYRWM